MEMELNENELVPKISQNLLKIHLKCNEPNEICCLNCHNLFSKDYDYSIKFIHNGYYYNIPFHNITVDIFQTKQEIIADQGTGAELVACEFWKWNRKDEYDFLDNIVTDSTDYKCYNVSDSGSTLKECMLNIMNDVFNENLKSKVLQVLNFTIDQQKLQTINHKSNQDNNYGTQLFLYNIKRKLKKDLNPEGKAGTLILSNHIKQKLLDIILERQNIGLRVSINKYAMPIILQTLCKICCLFNHRNITVKSIFINVLSPSVATWYCRNVSQGFLLKILLATVHVNTLSILTNFYFILFTHISPNLNVQIKFTSNPALSLTIDLYSSNTFLFKWKVCRNDSEKSMAISQYNLNTSSVDSNTVICLKFLIAIIYAKSAQESSSNKISFQENTILQRDTYVEYPYATKTSVACSVHNILGPYNNLEELRLNEKELDKLSVCDDHDLSSGQSIFWLSEFYQMVKELQITRNIHNMFECQLINETIFEATSLDVYNTFFKPLFTRTFIVQTCLNICKTLSNVSF